MKKRFDLSLLLVILAIILSLGVITGCGDDGSYTVIAPTGPTGPQGDSGPAGPTGVQTGRLLL